MTCEWPEKGENGCTWEAELKVGFDKPVLCFCRVHAVAVVFKLLLESPVPQPIKFEQLQLVRIGD